MPSETTWAHVTCTTAILTMAPLTTSGVLLVAAISATLLCFYASKHLFGVEAEQLRE